MNVFVINCGSSSLKYQLIDAQSEKVLAKGLCERIGIRGSRIVYKPAAGKRSGEKITIEEPMPDHTKALEMVLACLVSEDYGVISSLGEIGAVGHRVGHGGEKLTSSVIINEKVIKDIEECCELAPLHNPANLTGINVCRKLMPGVPMVAVFDTAFHQTMPEKAYLYGIPYHYYTDYKIRRYGFHGTSHSYVSKKAAQLLGVPYESLKTIVCHLGNGASVCAVKNGKSVDTSMGFTPVAGLIMGTRCGDIDPAIVDYLTHKDHKSVDEVNAILNKESGIYGLSGGLVDFRDIRKGCEEGDEKCLRAMDVFMYHTATRVGSYVASMNGVDVIVFTAGIGENGAKMRKDICEQYWGYLGITIDDEKNNLSGEDVIISTPDSKVKVMVIGTNEELMIARETMALAGGSSV